MEDRAVAGTLRNMNDHSLSGVALADKCRGGPLPWLHRTSFTPPLSISSLAYQTLIRLPRALTSLVIPWFEFDHDRRDPAAGQRTEYFQLVLQQYLRVLVFLFFFLNVRSHAGGFRHPLIYWFFSLAHFVSPCLCSFSFFCLVFSFFAGAVAEENAGKR